MSKFGYGQNPSQIRSLQWIDSTNKAFKNHVVRMALGTADACEYCHSDRDLVFGVLLDEGTQNNWLQVATEGIVKVVNSLAGTVNKGDPVILDYTNSGGTVGKVRSAFVASEALTAKAPEAYKDTDTGTYLKGGTQALDYRAVPGSIRMIYAGGGGVIETLFADGRTIRANGTRGFGTGAVSYTIDQPVIGYALEEATTPGQEFRIVISKQRYIKNNANS